MKVKIADIVILDRKRKRDDEDVLKKAASMDDVGLITPIILREGNILVDGLHRLGAASECLDWEEINITMWEDLSDLEAEKLEIEANFQQMPLNKLQAAQHALRRRELWEIEHGPITHGPEKGSRDSKQSLQTFGAMISRLLGTSRILAYAIIKIARDLDPGVQETIAGLPICDNRAELKRLAGLTVREQRKIAKKLKDGTIAKVSAPDSPTVDEDAPPEPSETPEPPRTPKTPREGSPEAPMKPQNGKANCERLVKDAIKAIKVTIKQHLDTLESEDYLVESTKSLIIHFQKQLIDQLKSIRK